MLATLLKIFREVLGFILSKHKHRVQVDNQRKRTKEKKKKAMTFEIQMSKINHNLLYIPEEEIQNMLFLISNVGG